MAIYKENDKIDYLAYAISNNTVIYPKKVYFANSNNTLKLVYERPTYDIHIINLAISTKLGNANKVTDIIFTNNLSIRNQAYNNNIVNVTYSSNIPTYEFLVQNDDNDTFTCYIANPFWSENSKVYCYGNFSRCFMDCQNLTSLDVSKFDTSEVTNISYMFYSCYNLTSLDLSNFKTDNVTNMDRMFLGCSSLISLDVSTFKTDNVTNMSYMFYGCSSLTSLDISTFKTDKVTNMAEMFRTCRNLERIISNTFSKQSQMNSTDAFAYCIKLVGSNGTVFDSTYTDAEYARIDGENGLPGYFTDPANQAKITLMNSKNDGLKYLDYITINSAYTIPTLESYTAVVTDSNGNTYNYGDTITITQNITLTFVWSANNNE